MCYKALSYQLDFAWWVNNQYQPQHINHTFLNYEDPKVIDPEIYVFLHICTTPSSSLWLWQLPDWPYFFRKVSIQKNATVREITPMRMRIDMHKPQSWRLYPLFSNEPQRVKSHTPWYLQYRSNYHKQ